MPCGLVSAPDAPTHVVSCFLGSSAPVFCFLGEGLPSGLGLFAAGAAPAAASRFRLLSPPLPAAFAGALALTGFAMLAWPEGRPGRRAPIVEGSESP